MKGRLIVSAILVAFFAIVYWITLGIALLFS